MQCDTKIPLWEAVQLAVLYDLCHYLQTDMLRQEVRTESVNRVAVISRCLNIDRVGVQDSTYFVVYQLVQVANELLSIDGIRDASTCGKAPMSCLDISEPRIRTVLPPKWKGPRQWVDSLVHARSLNN